jgi:deoxyribodipyrimidine photolyase-related protein
MTVLRLVLGDQLSPDSPALLGADLACDVVLMIESADECAYVPHHRQKIVLFLSAMRHFANALRNRGFTVDYVALDDAASTGTLAGEVSRAAQRHGAERVVMGEPGEWRLQEAAASWEDRLDIPVTIRPDHRFLCTRAEFAA